jgi:hypothetical protein
VNQAEELERTRVRHLGTAHLDPRPLSHQLGVRFSEFTVEQKGGIGIEAFLQSVQLRLGTVPRVWFVHDEHDLIRLGVVPDQVDQADAIFGV